jgi:hypothetical protein
MITRHRECCRTSPYKGPHESSCCANQESHRDGQQGPYIAVDNLAPVLFLFAIQAVNALCILAGPFIQKMLPISLSQDKSLTNNRLSLRQLLRGRHKGTNRVASKTEAMHILAQSMTWTCR